MISHVAPVFKVSHSLESHSGIVLNNKRVLNIIVINQHLHVPGEILFVHTILTKQLQFKFVIVNLQPFFNLPWLKNYIVSGVTALRFHLFNILLGL